jgi:organic hydroperoxide reductase OsmC/OhrA
MAREFRFPVSVDWEGDRLTTAYVDGKHPLSIATPPEFRGTEPDVWSPEDLFAAAAASCLAVTIAALAEPQGVALLNL